MKNSSLIIWCAAVGVYLALGLLFWQCDDLRKSHFSIEEAKRQAEENKKKIAARKAASAGKDSEKKEIIPPKELEKIGKNLAKKKKKRLEKELAAVDETIAQIDERTKVLKENYRQKRSAEEEMYTRIAAVALGMRRFAPHSGRVNSMVQQAESVKNDAVKAVQETAAKKDPSALAPRLAALRPRLENLERENQVFKKDELPAICPALYQGRLAWLHQELARLLAAALRKDYEKAREFPSIPIAEAKMPDSDHPDDLQEYLDAREEELDMKYAEMKVLEDALQNDSAVDAQIDEQYLDQFAAETITAAQETEERLQKADQNALRNTAEEARRAAEQAKNSANDAKNAQRDTERHAAEEKRKAEEAVMRAVKEQNRENAAPNAKEAVQVAKAAAARAEQAAAQAAAAKDTATDKSARDNAQKESAVAAFAAAQARKAAGEAEKAETAGRSAEAQTKAAEALAAAHSAEAAAASAAAGKPRSGTAAENAAATQAHKAAQAEGTAVNAQKESDAAARAAAQAQTAAEAARSASQEGRLEAAQQYAQLARQAAQEAQEAAASARSGQPRKESAWQKMGTEAAASAAQAAAQAQTAAVQTAAAAQPRNESSQQAASQAQTAAGQAQKAAHAAGQAAAQGNTLGAVENAATAKNAAAAAGKAAAGAAGQQLPADRESLRAFSDRYDQLTNEASSLASKAASMARQSGLNSADVSANTLPGSQISAQLAQAKAIASVARSQGAANGMQTDLSAMMRSAAVMGGGNTPDGGGSGMTSDKVRNTGMIVGADAAKRKRVITDLNDGKIISNSIPGRRIYQNAERKGWVFVDAWYVIGPWDATNIPSSKLPVQAPEKRIDLDGEYNGKIDPQTRKPIKLRWRYVQTDTICVRPPDKMENSYYYAYTDVWFAEGMDMNIILGSDDAGKIWINGMVVWEDEGLSSWSLCEGIVKVYFKPGWNKILIRIHNGPDECQFSFAMAPPLKTK